MKKIIVSLVSLVLILGLVGAVSADELNVATTGTDSGDCQSSDCLTIGYAISQADPGDTINVAAGTYSSSTNGESFPITIDKSLTLKGAQFGIDPTVEGARIEESEESVIDASGTQGNAIEITANDVTLEGFTIKDVATDVKYGITVLTQSGDHSIFSSGITIQNNILNDNNRGMKLEDNENSLVKQNRIVRCGSITPGLLSGGSGIVLSFVKPTTLVTENVLSENVAKVSYYGPILVAYGTITQPTITNNQITNNYVVGPSWGIVVIQASAIIRGNTITGNQGGGIWTLWQTAEMPTILIEDNVISENGLTGIDIAVGTPVLSITGNTISDNGGVGIIVQYNMNADVSIHYNNIVGNDGGVSSPTLSVDATCNWWGAMDGPSGEGPGSTGDAVSDNVDFEPWLLSAAPDGVCGGYEEVAECMVNPKNHGQFVSCVAKVTRDLLKDGVITGKEKGAIVSWAARADIP